MYKTKLQELCHQRRWGLPRYSAVKDGPDHMPRFKGSVYVNGVTFTSSSASSSLKEASNQAAMLAFLNFTSGSSTPTATHDTEERIEVKLQNSPIPVQSSVVIDDMDRFCQNQPQNNARNNNLDPPANGQSFETPAFFNTIKEADHAAVKLDLMSLSPDIFGKAKIEGFCKPTYKTMQVGSPPMPTFFSTVEIEGMEFHSKRGRSQKEAEEDAAKIAYIALKECRLIMHSAFSPSQIENKALHSIHYSDIAKCIQNLKLEDGILDLELNEALLANFKVTNELHNPSFLHSTEEEMMNSGSLWSCESGSRSTTKITGVQPPNYLALAMHLACPAPKTHWTKTVDVKRVSMQLDRAHHAIEDGQMASGCAKLLHRKSEKITSRTQSFSVHYTIPEKSCTEWQLQKIQ
ncbi:hypothetical protein VNO78_27554 [Psophocarpus tetragonolobus]|uniref:DRBM domain-containing protein n=1 Tax=Psophocarpus tetragonolobus TaxID=3891 RepID=A0AAN9S0P2_PSOTE